MRAIRKDPAQRYGSWLDFGKELSQAFAALRWSARRCPTRKNSTELRQMPFLQGLGDVALWRWCESAAGGRSPPARDIREDEQGDSFYC